MPTTITDIELEEGSTGKVTAVFTDEDGDPATPKTLFKTITDLTGNEILARAEISSGLASTMNIAISGTNIPVPADSLGYIVLLLEGTYDSSLGSDLPLNDECRIPVNDLIGL